MNNELFLGRMFRVQLFCLVAFACCNPCLSQIAEYRRVFVPADTPDVFQDNVELVVPCVPVTVPVDT